MNLKTKIVTHKCTNFDQLESLGYLIQTIFKFLPNIQDTIEKKFPKIIRGKIKQISRINLGIDTVIYVGLQGVSTSPKYKR